jgi:hypothetical protein
MYITEDLTTYRQQLVSKIQIARIESFWTNDGENVLKKTSNSPKVMGLLHVLMEYKPSWISFHCY